MPKRARWLSPPLDDLMREDAGRSARSAAGRRGRARASAPAARPLERDIVKAIREWLKIKGVMAWKTHPGPFGNQIGVSDILGCLKPSGRLLAIEVKRIGGKVSKEQRGFIDNVNDQGGLAFVAYSLEDVINTLGCEVTL